MNRRKYILSTLGLGAGLGIASQYNTQPSIASNINLADSITLPDDIEKSKEFTVQLTIDSLGLTPQRIGSDVNLSGVEVRGKTNSTPFNASESIPIRNDILLSNNQTVNDVLKESQVVIPLTVEFNENSSRIIVEFIIDTDKQDFIIQETIPIVSNNISEPNESEPDDLGEVFNSLRGSGTEEDPYVITNDHELQCIDYNEDSLSADYVLANDIDMSLTKNWYNDDGFKPIGDSDDRFEGNINGKGHKIDGLYINRKSRRRVGLIGYSQNSYISNINLINVNITGDNEVGGLIGNNRGKIINSMVSGSVNSERSSVGVLAGINNDEIINCYSTGTVESEGSNVGGLVGYNTGGDIKDSYSECDIKDGDDNVGGLVGRSRGLIDNSYATGDVTQQIGWRGCGGLVGTNENLIENSYATGDVDGGRAGGLVGWNYGAEIYNSYATGNIVNGGGGLVGHIQDDSIDSIVSNTYATGNVEGNGGGLVNMLERSELTNSYAVGDVTGSFRADGLIGDLSRSDYENLYFDNESTTVIEDGEEVDSSRGIDLDTSEMKGESAETKMGALDFDNVWETVEGDYPVLQALDTQLQLDNR